MPYDINSKIPKGVRKTINGLGYCTFDKFVIELKINPVENAEKTAYNDTYYRNKHG